MQLCHQGTAFPVETDLSQDNVHYRHVYIDYSGMGGSMYVIYIKRTGTLSPLNPRFTRVYARRIYARDVRPALVIRAAVQDVDKSYSNVEGTGDGRALAVWSDEIDPNRTDTGIIAVRRATNRVYLPGLFSDD